MELIIITISILVISGFAWVVRKLFKAEFICPVCTGVMLTWLWLLVGLLAGKLASEIFLLPTAILMGGTIVGLMAKLEKNIKSKFLLIWKIVFVILGFSAFYGLLIENWLIFIIGALLAIVVTMTFKTKHETIKEESEQVKKLEEQMKNCC